VRRLANRRGCGDGDDAGAKNGGEQDGPSVMEAADGQQTTHGGRSSFW